jgi:SNF2 family DNA or RNA helicase
VLLIYSKILQKLRPKPGFPLNDKQQHEKALVLDEESGAKIPAAINTYLRNYQRDGARFLWRQYKEGRGGLLGDDMGLVRAMECSVLLFSDSFRFHF